MDKLRNFFGAPFAGAARAAGSEGGQTFVEYAMILALIAVVLVGALTFLHDQVAHAYTSVANAI
jgi:Flp pilus assembly pilin Flp